MWYAIMTEDYKNSLKKRLSVRVKHIERLKDLIEDGRLLIAGPHPAIDAIESGPAGFSGSLIVADFDTLEEAEFWAKEDPYIKAKVTKKIIVKPYNLVLP
tara:strand:- start:956 stop:1255 length:300 start_codon:yes stop_codon:yes gene_type:complete